LDTVAFLHKYLIIRAFKFGNDLPSINYFRVKRGRSQSGAEESELFYRSLQIIHEKTAYLIRYLCPGCQVIAAFTLIAVGYSLVGIQHSNPFILIMLSSIGIFTFIFYYRMLELFAEMQESSRAFPKLHEGVLSVEFRRSCRQIRWEMVGLYYVQRSTFPRMIQNLVIRALIKLVISFRN